MYKNIKEIKFWLDSMKIENYTINDNFTVDVDGDVSLAGKGIKEIPIKFNYVKYSFNIADNWLTSLRGCPEEVGAGFYCQNNKLTDLIGSPKKIVGDFYCSGNDLESLKGIPKNILGDLSVSGDFKEGFKSFPERIEGYLIMREASLTDIKNNIDYVGKGIELNIDLLTNKYYKKELEKYAVMSSNSVFLSLSELNAIILSEKLIQEISTVNQSIKKSKI